MSLHKLLKLADCDGLDADCRAWLQAGVSRYVDGNGSLDSCLDIRCHQEQIFEIRRNRHLRNAAKSLPRGSQWMKAVRLAKEARYFERVFWPKWRLKAEPPSVASELRMHLFYARREKSIPSSPRQLHRIIIE